MDTLIGKFNLTENQISNMSTLNVAPFKGGSFNRETKDYVAVSDSEPTQEEIENLSEAIEALPDVLAQAVLISSFSVDLLTIALGLTFDGPEAIDLAQYLGVVQSYAKFKNFAKLKEFLGGLVALGKATEEQADKIKDAVLEQGIDLDNF